MEDKLCPLFMMVCPEIACHCQGERCAWFYCGRCAILELAMNTGDIQNIADTIDFYGG